MTDDSPIRIPDRIRRDCARKPRAANRRKLEETALSTLKSLNDLEPEFFGFTVWDGMVVADNPEYRAVKR